MGGPWPVQIIFMIHQLICLIRLSFCLFLALSLQLRRFESRPCSLVSTGSHPVPSPVGSRPRGLSVLLLPRSASLRRRLKDTLSLADNEAGFDCPRACPLRHRWLLDSQTPPTRVAEQWLPLNCSPITIVCSGRIMHPLPDTVIQPLTCYCRVASLGFGLRAHRRATPISH